MAVNHISPKPWTGRNDPEDGDLALRVHHLAKKDTQRALIGFCSEAGVIRNKGRSGASQGPTALRKALANLAAPENPVSFSDLGDIEVTGDDLEAGQAALAKEISSAMAATNRVVVLGGGHETAFGSYCGLAEAFPGKQIGIINLDAHLDLRLPGKSGPSSGTPFAQIRELNTDNFDYLCIGLAEESNTAALMNRAKDWGVQIVTDHELIANQKAANNPIKEMIDRCDLVYLTIDLDVLPHFQAPGVSAPAPRGVPFSTIEYLIGYLLSTCDTAECQCPLADIVELSPPHDLQNVTAKGAALLARRLLFS